ncbi:MAG: phosphatase PAP2 family protein [Candidatus Nanoarchaeia archaeon]
MDNKNIFIFTVIVLLIVLSFSFDSLIIRLISELRIPLLDDFFLGLTFASSDVIVFFFLTSLFLWKSHKRGWVLPLWFTLLLTGIISFIIKYAIQRPRPYQLGLVSAFEVLQKASHIVWNFSFPSFQAMLVFSAIPILSKEFPKFKYIWIIFAGLVGFSRVYFGVHFLSDVLAGGLIGYIIGALIVKQEEENEFFKRAYKRVFKK